MKTNPSTFKLIISRIKVVWYLVLISLLLALGIVVLTLLIPVLIGNAIDLIIGINQVDFSSLYNIFIKFAICLVSISILQWFMNYVNNKIAFIIARNIRNDTISKIQRIPLSYIDTKSNGEIVSNVINDVDTFIDGLLLGFSQLFTGVLTILGTLAIMIYYNWIIALIVFVLTPMSIFVAKFIASRIYSTFKSQASVKATQTAFIEEMINQQKVVHAFNHQAKNEDDFNAINENLKAISLKSNFYSSLTNPITRFLNALVYAAVAILGAYLILTNKAAGLSIGALATLLSYANQYSKPFNDISSVVTEMQNSFACASRIFKLLDAPEMEDDSNKLEVNLSGNVTLKDVFFAYDKNKPLIENFSIDVKKGNKIAIVGPTGCGKTTIINLLMNFYLIDKGEIYFDNINVKDIKIDSLRANIGMVLQDTWLKTGTIKENICFGKEDASDKEIEEAIKLAYCKNFIDQLPDGINTIINEDGGNLSAGQKQLLCIARLMLLKPPILILDEATSNIDTRTELKISEAFNTLMENKTSFIVAHRLSTIQNADKIIAMKDGHIMEIGSHEELLAKNGFYASLYMAQFEAVK